MKNEINGKNYKNSAAGYKTLPQFIVYANLFIIGGCGYNILEILWRGYTHISMTLAGGTCFLAMYCIKTRFSNWGIIKRGLISSAFITLCELIFGIIFNVALKMNIWDYSDMPFNLFGQICLPYTALWFFLSVVIQYIFDITIMI